VELRDPGVAHRILVRLTQRGLAIISFVFLLGVPLLLLALGGVIAWRRRRR
jgi:LPXTG-motif cell wall-anchored protein